MANGYCVVRTAEALLFLAATPETVARQAVSQDDSQPRTPLIVEAVEALSRWLAEHLGPPLHTLHHPIDVWLGQVPMWVAMVCCMGLFAAAVLWVWTLKRSFIFRGAPDQAWWRDLRIWATVVVLPYILIYLLLGR